MFYSLYLLAASKVLLHMLNIERASVPHLSLLASYGHVSTYSCLEGPKKAQPIVLAIRESGHLLDTQTLKIHP